MSRKIALAPEYKSTMPAFHNTSFLDHETRSGWVFMRILFHIWMAWQKTPAYALKAEL
jgi:hypothetical protein